MLVSHCSIELGDNVKAKILNSQQQGKLEQNVKPDCLQNCDNVPHLKSLPTHNLTEERNQICSNLEGTDRDLKIKHAISNDTIIVPENVGIVPSKDVTNDMYIQKDNINDSNDISDMILVNNNQKSAPIVGLSSTNIHSIQIKNADKDFQDPSPKLGNPYSIFQFQNSLLSSTVITR